jgi:broad specificity phosphatase PhoE
MKTMTTVYFVRHGEYRGQDKFVAFRAKGFPLSPKGKKQAERLAEFFLDKKVAAIYASPAQRCQETAKIIGEKLGLRVVTDNRLAEVKSPFNGIDREKYFQMKGENSLYDLPAQIAEGETIAEIEERMKAFLKETTGIYKNKTVVAVSHADPITILRRHLTGENRPIGVGEYFCYEK